MFVEIFGDSGAICFELFEFFEEVKSNWRLTDEGIIRGVLF